MIKFLMLLMAFFSFTIELNAGEKKTDAKRLFVETHSYICFDNKFYIHDPDCKCDSLWGGVVYGTDGNVKETIHLIKSPVTDYD